MPAVTRKGDVGMISISDPCNNLGGPTTFRFEKAPDFAKLGKIRRFCVILFRCLD